MRTFFKRFWGRFWSRLSNEKGQSLIIIAFAFIGIVALVGLAIDLGVMYVQRTRLGQAVDAAALAGAQELPNEIAAWDRAEEYLRTNGYDLNDPDVTIAHGFPDEPVFGNHYQMTVTGTKSVPLTFLRVIGFTEVQVQASATGENANRLDIMVVMDKTGSMDDDTCYITRTDPQYACQPWLRDCATLYQTGFDDLSGWTTGGYAAALGNDPAYMLDGNYVYLEGNGTDGYIYRTVPSTGYDRVKVTFWTRNIGMEWYDYLRVYWRPTGSSSWTREWSESPPSSWTQYQVVLPAGAGNKSGLQIRFGLYNTEIDEYALIDNVTVEACKAGLGPCDGSGCSDDQCNGGGQQDCGDSSDPWQNIFHEQPTYDTMVAIDGFLDFLDSDLDQVGLASYSTSASVNIELSNDFDAVTTTVYTINPSGCTNIGDGIYAGINGLSTQDPHNGRTNAVHIMILLSDGWTNTWPGSGGCACDTSPPCPYDPCPQGDAHVMNAVNWARDNGIVIFAIGQGACVNETLLRNIAETTFGRYYWAPTTEELDDIFQQIAEYIFLRLIR